MTPADFRPPLPPNKAFRGDHPVTISPRLELPNAAAAKEMVLAAAKKVPVVGGLIDLFMKKGKEEGSRKTVLLLNLCIEKLEDSERDVEQLKARLTSEGFIALFRRAADELAQTADQERLIYLRNAVLNIASSPIPDVEKDILMEVICALGAVHVRCLYAFWRRDELISGIDQARIQVAAARHKDDADFDPKRVAFGLAIVDLGVPAAHAAYIVNHLESLGLVEGLLDMTCVEKDGYILAPLAPITSMGALVINRILQE